MEKQKKAKKNKLKNPKEKGSRVERLIKKIFEKEGYEVIRSAASLGKADLYIEDIGSIQVKARKTFSVLKLFDGADILIIKESYKKPYVVIELEKFINLLKGAKNGSKNH